MKSTMIETTASVLLTIFIYFLGLLTIISTIALIALFVTFLVNKTLTLGDGPVVNIDDPL